MRRILPFAAALSLTHVAAAQASVALDVDVPVSYATWSCVLPPAGDFNTAPVNRYDGGIGATLSPSGADPIATVFLDGSVGASAANPFVGTWVYLFIIVARLELTGLQLRLDSPVTSLDPAGNGSMVVTWTITSGTLAYTPLIAGAGVATATDVSGAVSAPATVAVSLVPSGNGLQLVVPVDASFQFVDSAGQAFPVHLGGTMRASWTPSPTQTYCTAKINSQGCTPAIAASGTPSYGGSAPFTITATNELNQKPGLLFHGFAAASTPFQGGFKCVASPTQRGAILSSGGSPSGNDCTGAYTSDFAAEIRAYTDPMLTPGREVFAQFWSRDPGVATTTNLSDAVRFTISP